MSWFGGYGPKRMSQVQVAAREFFGIKAAARKKLLICKLLRSFANRLWNLICTRTGSNSFLPMAEQTEGVERENGVSSDETKSSPPRAGPRHTQDVQL